MNNCNSKMAFISPSSLEAKRARRVKMGGASSSSSSSELCSNSEIVMKIN